MGPYRKHLDVLQIDSPCSESWTKMEGGDAVRFCRICESHVYDLSEHTRDEATALLGVTEGRICVRFYRRADGRVATKDCTRERAIHDRRRRRRSALAGAAAAVLVGATGAVASLWPAPPHADAHEAGPRYRDPLPAPHRSWIDPEELPDLPQIESRSPSRYSLGGVGIVHPREPAPFRIGLGRSNIPGVEDDL